MWLLNTDRLDKLELVEVSEQCVPRYAILSHTWGREEVTFQEIQAFSHRQWSRAVSQTASAIQAKKGFVKIRKAAALAAKHGYSYIWVDTCCIDKTSSAELSEAINSMFRWYNKASICYAYMEDVKYGYHDSRGGLFHLLCQDSRWFTRGWTLQELIAPEDILFYGEDWGYLGSKAHDEDVRISLAKITGIDVRVLEGIIQPSEISIAARMKWASQRETTRLEDVAYCLMGLFDVNMPLLYGEGTKAFIRLQEEILKGSNDHSIFTWKTPKFDSNKVLSGLLAETPQYFTYVENYRPMPPSVAQGSTAWITTNQGLRLSLFLLLSRDGSGNEIEDEYDAVLECAIRRGDEAYQSPAIRMRRLYGDQFARVDPQILKCVVTPSFDPSHDTGSYDNILRSSGSHDSNLSCHITKVWPEKYWDEEAATLRTKPSHSNRVTGLFRFFAPTIVATVDFAVGLRRKSGGAWVVWHLQRPSTGEPLHQTVASVNGYLASGSGILQEPIKPPDWLEHPWKVVGENQRIQVRVEEIKVHGRLYHFIKASTPFELPGIPKSPLSELSSLNKPPTSIFRWPYTGGFNSFDEMPNNFSLGIWGMPLLEQSQGPALSIRLPPPPVIPPPPVTAMGPPAETPTEDETVQNQIPTHLKKTLEDITIPNSLDYSLEFSHLTPMSKWRSKIRTAWAHPPAKDLERLEIQGVRETETKLLRACKDGREQEVSELIHHDLECLTWIPYVLPLEFNGFRPIHWAVVGGHTEVIHTLLVNGADFYSRTIQGWSSIHLAALLGRFVTMKWLIEYAIERHGSSYEDGSLPDDRSNLLLESPLHLAVSHVSLAVGDELLALTEILEELGVSTFWTSPNHADETPLHRLAASGPIGSLSTNTSIIEIFLLNVRQFKFSGQCLDGLGRTVLWHAVCAGSTPEVEHLIEDNPITLSMEDKNGMTPLHTACRLGHAKTARALLQAGASPNAATMAPGLTAAHYAALYNHPDCLQELITYGADVHKPTEIEEISFRPIHLAAANGYWGSYSILRDAGGDVEWRCTHYISRSVSFLRGELNYRSELVKCKTSVTDLSIGYQRETLPSISTFTSTLANNSPVCPAPDSSSRMSPVEENPTILPPPIPFTSNDSTESFCYL